MSKEQTDSNGYPALTKEIVSEILKSAAPYSNNDEKEACQRMVEALSPEEQQSAACTSYAYWFALCNHDHDNEKPSEEIKLRMAMREARRHLVGSDNDEAVALERFRVLCQYRIRHHMDLFRSCYTTHQDGGQVKEGSLEEEEIKATFRTQIEEELTSKQPFFVRGHDRELRAVAIKMGRQSPETDHNAYVTTQLYVAERAIACSEFLSRGAQEKVLAVMDFEGYSSSNAPPMLTLKESISLLQSNYPERLKTAIITEPAFWMKGLYNLLYPLMSIDTRDKIQMAYGEGKHETISALMEPQQAMPFMMPEGKLESPIDVDTFLRKVPFHCLYDSSSSS